MKVPIFTECESDDNSPRHGNQVLSNLDSRVEASDQRMTNDATWQSQGGGMSPG